MSTYGLPQPTTGSAQPRTAGSPLELLARLDAGRNSAIREIVAGD